MTLPIEAKVREIINAVKQNGDQALLTFTQKFDGLDVKDIKVGPETLKKAYENAPQNLIDALFHAKANIEAFHKLQLGQESLTWKTSEKTIRLETVPLDRVAIYAPGGRAAYPSSVLMNAIPAQIAGVKEIVLLTPPTQSPETNPVYIAAWLLGITEVYSVGGAQAVAAAAYGTETIHPVDLISGPGNAYVTEAKRQVFGDVAIDMLAGPTELTIIADDSANPSFIAADLLAQAEHDPEAKLTLVDLGMDLDTLKDTLQLYLKENPTTPANRSIQCLEIKKAKTIQDATELVNKIAPEHLSLQTRDNAIFLKTITKAGSIFSGKYTTEALGDYAAGSNHVLPTNGTSRFSSCLNVSTFLRRYQIIEYQDASSIDFDASATLAEFEGLYFHKKSLEVRR